MDEPANNGAKKMKSILGKLKAMRLMANLSQADLGREIGTSHVTVGRIENGKHDTGIQTLVRWCEACGYEVEFKVRAGR